MEDLTIQQVWKAENQKLEQILAINRQLLSEIISQKAASAVAALIRFKTRAIVAAAIYLMILGSLLIYPIAHYSAAANYFIVSMGAIFLINIKALADYIKHLVWAGNIDFSGSVTTIQEKLTAIQLSIFKHTRIMVLQFPFWTTFYLSNQWFPENISWAYIALQLVITGFFTWLAIWLFRHLRIENAHNKWVKIFIEGAGGKPLLQALAFYQEIEDFKAEN